jgi:hypothetical protein
MIRTLASAAVASFREGFGGDVVLPGYEGYDAARIVWTLPWTVTRPWWFGRPESTTWPRRCGSAGA